MVVVPYPGAGNINPALQIAELLHRHGAYVTFVNKQDYGRGVSVSLRATGAAPLKRLVSFAPGVAGELGVPSVAFWGGSAASLMAHMSIRELKGTTQILHNSITKHEIGI